MQSLVRLTLIGIFLILAATFVKNGFSITESIPEALSYFVLISQLFLASLLLIVLLKIEHPFLSEFFMQLKSEGLALALIVSMCATLGSLSFQFVLGWEPCELCWFQRIFMYPLLIIGGVALYYKRSDVFVYVLPLSLIGGIISVYHYGVQFFDLASVCSVLDGPSKCALKLFAPFGYMTIPMMALTAFILNIVLIYIAESNNKSKNRI